MSRSYNHRPVQPIPDLKTKFDNDFGPTENVCPLSANSPYSLANKQLITLEIEPTLEIDFDQEDPDLTPTAAHPRVSWQESGISLVPDRRSFDGP